MFEMMQVIAAGLGLSTEMAILIGVAVGSLMLFVGFVSVLIQKNPAAVRLANTAALRRQKRADNGLLRTRSIEPGNIMKSFLPKDVAERTQLHRKLAQAGRTGPNALRNFTLVRIVLGLVLPGWLLIMVFASRYFGMYFPSGLNDWVAGLSSLGIFQAISVLVAAGYYLPMLWLHGRVSERKLKITESFPNALDLMQISVEAGLGFDAAMTRVGNELTDVAPELAYEFLSVQHQVQAGRPREAAMRDMADRTGVEVVASFANVVHQSMQFGTSMSDALTAYASEMRLYREMTAQEMANKLPVKLSVVMASLMLPALVLETVGPVVIRYMNMFSG